MEPGSSEKAPVNYRRFHVKFWVTLVGGGISITNESSTAQQLGREQSLSDVIRKALSKIGVRRSAPQAE
jgi:hypothetical protein